jgi:hypothetical protein
MTVQYAIVTIIALGIAAFVWSRIFWNAGWGRWTGVLMVVPVVNLLMLGLLAFGRWPVHDRLEALEHELRELRQRLP